MSFRVFLVCLGMLLIPFSTWAGIREVGNGGDPIALEFQSKGFSALEELENNPELRAMTENRDLRKILIDAQILVSDNPLYATKEGVQQESAAINYKIPQDTIVINRLRWNEIQNEAVKKALALHEILSLGNLEATGDYRISGRYLSTLGMKCGENLCSVESPDPETKLPAILCLLPENESLSLYSSSHLSLFFLNRFGQAVATETVTFMALDSAPFGHVAKFYASDFNQNQIAIHYFGEQPATFSTSDSDREAPLSFNGTQTSIQGMSCYNLER